jgi:LmbE family N-acetylglucosaminyl deacetylase
MKVLAISVHPDDETLGCGGTLLRHRADGDQVSWLIVTRGHSPQWAPELLERKVAEVERVAAAYGMGNVLRLGLPTVRLDALPQAELMGALRSGIESLRPEIVYLVHGGDVHSDHQVVFQATMRVLKAFSMGKLGVRRVLSYETLSSTEAAPPEGGRQFLPNVFRDITPYLERKIEIMAMYATEAQADPWPRGPAAIRALARYRGATVGVEYAEAFMLIREVE